MKLLEYSIYDKKESEISDVVPAGWNVLRAKSIFKNISNKNHPHKQLLSVYRDYGVIIRNSREDNKNIIPDDLSNYKLVLKEYLVFNKMKAWQGSLGISEHEGIVSPAYITCKPILQNENKYFHLLLRGSLFIKEFEKNSYGVRPGQWDLRYEDFANFKLIVPPIESQKIICKFINNKCLKIDSKIKLLQNKITSYEDLKKSLIEQTVCRGLNNKIELKHSEIEWVGDIPKHWKVDRIKNRFISEKTTVGNLSTDYKLLSLTQNGVIYRDLESGFGKFPAEFNTYQIVKKNDLIFCLFDMDVTPRTIGYSDYFGMITGAYTIINSKKGCNKYYYYLFLMADISKKLSFAYTGLRSTIRKDKFFAFSVPVPDLHEQVQIANYLDEKTTKIDNIISKIKDQVNTLKEFRKTLINDVVTGKVRVEE